MMAYQNKPFIWRVELKKWDPNITRIYTNKDTNFLPITNFYEYTNNSYIRSDS